MLAERTHETEPEHGVYPRTVRYCTTCAAHTPHELRPEGIVCAACAFSLLELDRD